MVNSIMWNHWNHVIQAWTGIHDIELKWNLISWNATNFFQAYIFREHEFTDLSLVSEIQLGSMTKLRRYFIKLELGYYQIFWSCVWSFLQKREMIQWVFTLILLLGYFSLVNSTSFSLAVNISYLLSNFTYFSSRKSYLLSATGS